MVLNQCWYRDSLIDVSRAGVTAEWPVSDFDVLVPEDVTNIGGSFD